MHGIDENLLASTMEPACEFGDVIFTTLAVLDK